ncbi:transcriptional regulator family: SRF-type [Paecilomyces variotii]|nr:transcriptional regulator family: SRF-type [Paecilomyces variotii]KAJ9226686.1 transcriptional regulator family: SRF-type [Paecilomyces variotii]KAJ9231460.1 transcriptional regulator family: SRF-type [Paecilomyces variotii]KAJ9234266.1 transcriptional regulator family: SRF-type [Paecilomyces variotii]KAJ9252668.1 transcriptional regulator family: SRF-type [Paecilomyces variotii]
MGRRKIEIKAIKDDRNRSVTFLKRKGGLFKKAHELSVLCSVDVAVIIFGHNKKLYEFSSGDIRETLGKYQYYHPHEHKGPADFAGKRDADDDDEDDSPGPEEPPQQGHPMVPPHLQNQPGFQHINHAPSASPPIPNGVPFVPRHGTPQPQGLSRPSSRTHMRRVSSNLVPQQHAHATPPPQNGFAYMPNPSIYNPNAPPPMHQQPPRPGQFPQYGHPGPIPQHQPPHPHPQHPQMQHIPQHPPAHGLPQQHPQHGLPPHQQSHPGLPQQSPPLSQQRQHPQLPPQVTQAYIPDQGRHSMPATFPPEHQHQPQPQPRPMPVPEPSAQQMSMPPKSEGSLSPPESKQQQQQPPPVKSRSIFTPIDDRGSVLARHFGVGPPTSESPRNDAQSRPDQENTNTPTVTTGPPSAPLPPARSATDPQRTRSMPSIPEVKPPLKSNSLQLNAKRPRLKVQIPSENSDGGSATADSSPRGSANKTATPAKAADGSHSGVVLPPPSPSAGALLSAGAQGPPNPFARPPPPGAASQNGTAYNNNNNIETPISALPSRFVSDALLPSPSSFFPEWGFGRSGPDSNMLPSPLTFPTPSVQNGPGFAREDEVDKKRKSPESGPGSDAGSKRVKT